MAVAEISAAVTSLRATLDGAKAMIGLRDAEAFRAKSIELQEVIMRALDSGIEAREAYSKQLDSVRALEAEVAKLKAWDAEQENYELKTIGRGAVAYMLKPEKRGSEPPHWLCPNCFANGKKTFLIATGTKERESWPRKSAQGAKWSFCLTAGTMGPRIRSDHEQTSTPEPHTGLQGEGGTCRRQR